MNIENLTMSYGTQLLFDNVNLTINEHEKIGIVGLNGAGKTTFLKIILGLIEPDRGKITIKGNARLGWLPQVINDEIPNMNISVFDFLTSARPIEKLSKRLQELYDKVAQTTDTKYQSKIFKEIDKIQKELEYWDVYKADSQLLKIIYGMNITDEMLEQKVSTLSGGQKSKIAFARLLYSKPEFILLDEPTNHLDKECKDYVINYLKHYHGSVMVISHDIDFLNSIITKTLFLDKRTKKMQIYNGNYDVFKRLFNEQEKSLQKQAEMQEALEEKLRTLINKYAGVSGKRKKMAQDREKKLEKLLENKIKMPNNSKKAIIALKINKESNNVPLKVSNLNFGYNKNLPIITNLSFELTKGEKFLIVGENGVGKSTLLKLIVGSLQADNGKIEIGSKTDIGYYAQEHELLDENKNILENFHNISIGNKELRNFLGRFLFFDDDVYKQVGILSPGEKSRVALAKLALQGANLLVLDEPTNHLDPDTRATIGEAFKTFPGTMLVVSHNPEFVDLLGIERILLLPSGKIVYYDRKIVETYSELNSKDNNKKRTNISKTF